MKVRSIIILLLLLPLAFKCSGSVTVLFPNVSGPNGSQITIPVKVASFQNLISSQFTIEFDPTILTYVSTQDYALTDIYSGSFGTTQVGSGKLTFSWYDITLSGIDLPDSAVFFSVTFNVIGTAPEVSPLSFSGTPTIIEFVDSLFVIVPNNCINGSFTVSAPGPSNDLTLYYDTIAGPPMTQVAVSLRAVDFVNINSIQGTVGFDPAMVTFTSISYFGLPGMLISDFNTAQAASGKLMFSWSDGTLLGQNMPDSSALFTITFDIIGPQGSLTPIKFASAPTLWEVSDSLFNTLNADTIDGYVRIEYLIGTDEPASASNSLQLLQNSPNPAATFTNISFILPEEEHAALRIFNILGDVVFERSGTFKNGLNLIRWDCHDMKGRILCNGSYFYSLITSGEVVTRKLTLIR